jgi:hypothetical protein
MNLYERMKTQVVLGDLADKLEQMIDVVNALSTRVFGGSNPHLVNDATNVLVVSAAGIESLDSVLEAGDDLETKYTAHIAATANHVAADSTNGTTDTSPIADVYVLLNELKTDYAAHRVLTAASVHAGADSVDVVTAANATTKATSFALANDLKTQFNLHLANVTSVHGAADTANPVVLADLTAASTWSEIMAMADSIRTKYEAHRILTDGSVHGDADATNTVSQSAIGTVQTAINGLLNELKTDFNAHIILMTSHVIKDDSMAVTAATATNLATSATLAKNLVTSYENHRTVADEVAANPQIVNIR